MGSLSCFSLYVGVAALLTAGGCLVSLRLWRRSFRTLRREVMRFSEDLFQMADLQKDIYHRICRDLNGLEERILDLAVPSSDGPLPLERRHQVLTLARKGADLGEISRRLNMPTGEAELILRLRKFMEAKQPPQQASGAPKGHTRAPS
jgi:hypothetical protein